MQTGKPRSRASQIISLGELTARGTTNPSNRRSHLWQRGVVLLPPYNPEEDDKQAKRLARKLKDLSYFGLFRYATKYDIILIIIGVICAIISSFTLPWQISSLGRFFNILAIRDSCTNFTPGKLEKDDLSKYFRNSEYAYQYCINAAGGALIQFFCTFVFTRCFSLSGDNQMKAMHSQYFGLMMRKDLAWFDNFVDREFAYFMTEEITQIRLGIGERLGTLIYKASSLFTLCSVMIILHNKLLFVFLATLPWAVIYALISCNALNHKKKESMNSFLEIKRIAEEGLANVKTLKVFNAEQKYIDSVRAVIKGKTPALSFYIIISAILFGVSWVCIYGFKFYMFRLIIEFDFKCHSRFLNETEAFTFYVPENSGPGLFVIFFAIALFLSYLQDVFVLCNDVSKAKIRGEEIFFVLDWTPRIDNLASYGKAPKSTIIGRVELSNLDFRYPRKPKDWIIRNLNLIAYPGQLVSIVGNAGSGKSTLLKLVTRLYDPCGGQVFLDGLNVQSLQPFWYRSNIAYLSQDRIVYNMSVEDNIRFGKISASSEEIKSICMEANIHEEIAMLPYGYRTIMGVRGSKVTDKLRTMVCLARVLLRRSKVILLDDPLEGADESLEQSILKCVQILRETSTLLCTSRRCDALVKSSDCIYVIKDGCIQESGTHLQLIKNKKYYYKMLEETLDSVFVVPQPKFQSQLQAYRFARALRKSRANKKIRDARIRKESVRRIKFRESAYSIFNRGAMESKEKRHFKTEEEFGLGGFQKYIFERSLILSPKFHDFVQRNLCQSLPDQEPINEARHSITNNGIWSSFKLCCKGEKKSDRNSGTEMTRHSPRASSIDAAHSLRRLNQVDWNVDADDNESIGSEDCNTFWDTYFDKIESVKRRKKKGPFEKILSHGKGLKKWILIGSFLSAVSACLVIPASKIEADALEELSLREKIDSIYYRYQNLQTGYIIIMIAGFFVGLAQDVTMSFAGKKIKNKIREALFCKIIYKEFKWFERTENDISLLLQCLLIDADCIQNFLCVFLVILIQPLLLTIVGLAYIVWLCPDYWTYVTLVALTAPIQLCISYFNEVYHIWLDTRIESMLASSSQLCSDIFSGISLCTTFCLQGYFSKKFLRAFQSPWRRILIRDSVSSLLQATSTSLVWFMLAGILYWGSIVLGLQFSQIYLIIEILLWGIVYAGITVARIESKDISLYAINRIETILMDGSELTPSPTERKIHKITHVFQGPPVIDIVDLSFSYTLGGPEDFFKNFNLQVKPYTHLAIVGPTGSGKTTLANILLGLEVPSSGFVFFDNMDLTTLSKETICSTVSLVEQEPTMFDKTIEQNLKFGSRASVIKFDRMQSVCKLVGIHDEIMNLDFGYDTDMSVAAIRGYVDLSFKQKIGIARLLLQNPKIAITDDLISPLDSSMDASIRLALEFVRKDRTLISFSQKIEPIRAADIIAVIRNGEITEMGSDAELLSQKGLYYEMYMTQKIIEANINEELESLRGDKRYRSGAITSITSKAMRRSSIDYNKVVNNLRQLQTSGKSSEEWSEKSEKYRKKNKKKE